jgi:hypothetical protein
MTIDEALQERGNIEVVGSASPGDLIGDLLGYVARPALGSVEGRDPRRVRILPIEQIGDEDAPVGALFISLAPRAAQAVARMVTYYFDFRTGDVLSQDEEGADLPDVEAAHRVALQAIADAIQDVALQDLLNGHFQVEVRDELGPVLEISAVLNSKILRKQ